MSGYRKSSGGSKVFWVIFIVAVAILGVVAWFTYEGVRDDSMPKVTQSEQIAKTDPKLTVTQREQITKTDSAPNFTSEISTSKNQPLKKPVSIVGISSQSSKSDQSVPVSVPSSSVDKPRGMQTVKNDELNVAVAFESNDDINKTTIIKALPMAKQMVGDKGLIGQFVDVKTTSTFNTAQITFKYDADNLKTTKESDLRIFWYNPENRSLEPVENQSVDVTNKTVTSTVKHFSIYLLADLNSWAQTWKDSLVKTIPKSKDGIVSRKPLDIVYVIDSTGSMGPGSGDDYNSDLNNDRIKQTQALVKLMTKDDRAAVVDFDSRALLLQGLIDNKDALIEAANKINSDGSTNISCGIEMALNELEKNGRADADNVIVFLTDGKDNEGGKNKIPADIDKAKSLGIKIYTVALGMNADRPLLKTIADSTGGDWYYADYANQLQKKFLQIGGKINLVTDVDTDGDGITDWVEKTGYIVKGTLERVIGPTDPNNPDTDGDGVSDGMELGTVYYDPDTRLVYVSPEPLVYNKPHEPFWTDPTRMDKKYDIDVYKQIDIISYSRLAFDKGSISYEIFEAIAKEAILRMEAYQKAAKGEVTLEFLETEELKYYSENFMNVELIQSIIKEAFGNEEQLITSDWDYETWSNTAVLQVAFKEQYPDMKVTGYIDSATESIFNEVLNPKNESLLQEDRPLSIGEKVVADVFGIPYGIGQSVFGMIQGAGELGGEVVIYTQLSPAMRIAMESAHMVGWMDDQRYRHAIDYLDKDQKQREEMFLSLPGNIWQGIKQDAGNAIQLPKDLFDPTKDINDVALTAKSTFNTGTLIYGGAKGFKAAGPKVFKALVITKEGIGKLVKTEGVLNLRAKFKDLAIGQEGYIRLPGSLGKAAAEAVPKFSSRLINAVVDSKIFNRVKELRGMLTSAYKKSGNFGYADVNVSGISKSEFYSHSSIDSLTGELSQRVPDISLTPEKPVFDALKVNGDNLIEGADAYLRNVDSEFKILNDIANRLGNNTSASGTIKLFTERVPCPSCSRVINMFMEKYKHIKIEVIDNSGNILY